MIQHCITALLLMPFISSDTLAALSHENEPASLSEFLLPEDGPAIGGWFEASYNDDGGNFAVGRNRIHVGGDYNDVAYMISVGYDGVSSIIGLRDAYATVPWGSTHWTFGQFRAPTTSGHLVDESKRFFMDPTGFGGDGLRQTGLMGAGSFDSFHWSVALMDDDDAELPGDDGEDLHARVFFDAIGTASSSSEGNYDTLGSTYLSIAAAIDSGRSGDSTYIEATMSHGPFWAHAELVDRETGSPLTVAAAYAINTQWEIGIRTQDEDTSLNPTTSAAVNRYISGHDCKWTVQFADGGQTDKRLSAGFLISF